jgi:transposase
MAYRYGDRQQIQLFPSSIEDYVKQDDPVRAYDAFVEALDFGELGVVPRPNKVGNSEYNPRSMLKLLVFGYSYGIRSSRKLERATYHNISFIWLMGGLKPDHKTIANFRKDNKAALKNVLKQCARLCIKLNLIEGNTLFVDGSKIRANASIKNTWTVEKCKRYLKHIDKHIESILSECDAVDEQEQAQPSLVKLPEELKDKETLKSEVKKIMQELKRENKKSTNTVDPDCTRINSVHGSHVLQRRRLSPRF